MLARSRSGNEQPNLAVSIPIICIQEWRTLSTFSDQGTVWFDIIACDVSGMGIWF